MKTSNSNPQMMNPNKPSTELIELTRAHIESFDYFLDEGRDDILKYIPPVKLYKDNEEYMEFRCVNLEIRKPTFDDKPLFPFMCRMGALTYSGEMLATYAVKQKGITKTYRRNGTS